MALNINKTFIGGRVGQTPELNYTKKGTAVTTVSLATNDPSDNENTLWHSVVIWGKSAENTCKFVQKGREVIIEGYNKPSKYTDKEGKTRSKHEVVAKSVTFVGSGNKKDVQETNEDYTVNVETNDSNMSFTDNDIPF